MQVLGHIHWYLTLVWFKIAPDTYPLGSHLLKAHCAPALHWELGGDNDEKKQTQAMPSTFIIFENFHSKFLKKIYKPHPFLHGSYSLTGKKPLIIKQLNNHKICH